MLIKQVCEETRLTKKAIDYYTEQGFVQPAVLDNGYRDFSAAHIDTLKKIVVLRKLGLGIADIKSVLADKSADTLQTLAARNHLRLQREKAKQDMLDRLSVQQDWEEIGRQINHQSMTIAERLLDAFPGYYGRFISLHFARFLNHPIDTPAQQQAYEQIVGFLDNVPPIQISEELLDYIEENTKSLGVQNIAEMNKITQTSIENPDVFLSENKEMLDWYVAYKQSDAYKNSPAYRLQTLLKEFNAASGYNDIFIPAMKKLSPSYAAYVRQLETANEKLLSRYPEINDLY